MWKALDPDIEFQISDLLLPEEDVTRLVRLLIAVRHLTALTKSIQALRDSESFEPESQLLLLVHLAASAKEAADRFRDADAHGLFRFLNREGEPYDQVRRELVHAREATDKNNPSSTYVKFLKPIRDAVGFHVDQVATAAAIETVRGSTFRAADVDGKSNVVSIPLVVTVALAMLPGVRSRPEEVGAIIDALFDFHVALRGVVHDCYLLLVRVCTLEKSQGSGMPELGGV